MLEWWQFEGWLSVDQLGWDVSKAAIQVKVREGMKKAWEDQLNIQRRRFINTKMRVEVVISTLSFLSVRSL